MTDPFRITEPTCISFSGGRTSAYMLWRVLQSNGGLPPEAVVAFANTGKEDEATLRFVRDCGEHWDVPIIWVEYRNDDAGNVHGVIGKMSFSDDKLVDNLNAFVQAILKAKPSTAKGTYVKKCVVAGCMSPGVPVAV